MARNDPTDTGGLFIGRRPGTAPVHYASEPEMGSPGRRRADRVIAAFVLVVETLVCLTLWGPQPVAWLWVGSQVNYQTGSVSAGIAVAFAGMIATLMLTLVLAVRLDAIWKVVRRAAGYDQREGVAVAHLHGHGDRRRDRLRLLVPHPRGPGAVAGAAVRRLFDRYRQFQELAPEEVSRGLRERRDEERRSEVVFVPELDLARTAWHEPPHPEAVNAATFALRRRMNAYPDPGAREVRELAAERHGVAPAQVAVGHGAAELLQEACAALLGGEGELLVAWPGWGPLPELAKRVGGRPVAVPGDERSGDEASGRGSGIGPLADRVGADTRAIALSSPNDPTGAPVAREDVRALCERVGEHVWVLLDEALADFLEPGEDAAGLVAELPNLLVFRTFAKAHAMAGFRIGYVLGPAEMAERLTPSFSVNAPAQAAAAWALELGDAGDRPPPRRRRGASATARRRPARHAALLPADRRPVRVAVLRRALGARDRRAPRPAAHQGRRRRAVGRRAPRPRDAARRRGHRPPDRRAARAGLTATGLPMARTHEQIDEPARPRPGA